MMKRYTGILLALICAISASGALPADNLSMDPKRELRGVWLATVWGIDWPSVQGRDEKTRQAQRRQLRETLDCAVACGLNAVYFQVRPMCDALYASSREPWSAMVSGERGVAPGWDPLQFAVEECHARGLECHAWINPFRWSQGADYNTLADKELKKRGWLLNYGKITVLNPGIPEVRDYVVDVCREIAVKYDVDGLVFDDYFYPNKIPATPEAPDYTLYINSKSPLSFADWRRANIHKLVAEMRGMTADLRHGLRFGISPAGVAGKAETSAKQWSASPCEVKAPDWQYNEIFSDPLGWLYQNTVDYISPQLYWPTTHATAPFEPLVRWWSAAASQYGVDCYASVTLQRLETGDVAENKADLLRQIELNRNSSAPGRCGFVIYSAKYLPKVKEVLQTAFGRAALPPVCSSVHDEMPSQPGVIKRRGDIVEWDKGNNRRFTVYMLPKGVARSEAAGSGGDGLDARYLVGVTYAPRIRVPEWCVDVAVCGYGADGTESAPVWL